MAFKPTLVNQLQYLLLKDGIKPLGPILHLARRGTTTTNYVRPGFALCREPPKKGDIEDKECKFYTISELLDYSLGLKLPTKRSVKTGSSKKFYFSTTMGAYQFTQKLSRIYSFLMASYKVEVFIKPAPGDEWASIDWTMKHQLHLNPNVMMQAMPTLSNLVIKPRMLESDSVYGWVISMPAGYREVHELRLRASKKEGERREKREIASKRAYYAAQDAAFEKQMMMSATYGSDESRLIEEASVAETKTLWEQRVEELENEGSVVRLTGGGPRARRGLPTVFRRVQSLYTKTQAREFSGEGM